MRRSLAICLGGRADIRYKISGRRSANAHAAMVAADPMVREWVAGTQFVECGEQEQRAPGAVQRFERLRGGHHRL